MQKHLIGSKVLFGFALLIFTNAAIAQEYHRAPFILKANDVLSQKVIKGDNYAVADKVVNDGYINTYKLNTDYGILTAEGTAELMIRIHELEALRAMEAMRRGGVFGDAVVVGVKAPFKGAIALVTAPIDTTKNIVKGTGQYLSNVGRSIARRDPAQDNVFKTALGYDVAKRQFAFGFGVNPYSSSDPVLARLGQISRSAVAGGIAVKAAMATVDHSFFAGMRVAGTAKGMKEMVRDNPPGKLRKINKKKLEMMGMDSSLAEAFQDNYIYDPQEKTLLIAELETMEGVKGRGLFIARANLAPEKSVALYFRLTAQMMAAYNANVKPVKAIRYIRGILHLVIEEGTVVLLAPVDYVFWTKGFADKLNEFEAATNAAHRELWVTGKFDKMARNQLEATGWKITENANSTLMK